MAIQVSCGGCKKTFAVKDEFAGRKVQCACGRVLAIPAAKRVTPPPLPTHPAEQEAGPARRSNYLLPGLVVGALAALVVIGAGVAGVLMVLNRDADPAKMANAGTARDSSAREGAVVVEPPRPGDAAPGQPSAHQPGGADPPRGRSPGEESPPQRGRLIDSRPVALDEKETEPEARPPVWKGNAAPVQSVAFSADGRLLLSGSGHISYRPGLVPDRSHNTVRVWDAWAGRQKRDLKGFEDTLSSVAFSPQGRYAVFSLSGRWHTEKKYVPSKDYSIRMWDLETDREVPSFKNVAGGAAPRPRAADAFAAEPRFKGHDDEVWCVAFSPDGSKVVSGGRDGTVRVWDVESGDEICHFGAGATGVHSVAFSPKGDRVAAGSYDYMVRLVDARSGQLLRTLSDHTDIVFGVAFSGDGRYVASAGGSRQDPDGHGFIPGTRDHTVRVWDAEAGTVVARLVGHAEVVQGVTFSPDSRRVVSCSFDKTVRVWDVATGRELRRFAGHTDIIRAVVVSPDGRFAASGSDDAEIRLWEMPVDARDLVAALEQEDVPRLKHAARHREEMGQDLAEAVPALAKGLKSPKPEVRRLTAQLLASLGPEAMAALPALAERLLDGSEGRAVRLLAVEAIGKARADTKACREALTATLRDPDAELAVAAARALGELPLDRGTLQGLLAAATHKDRHLRAAARAGLLPAGLLRPAVKADELEQLPSLNAALVGRERFKFLTRDDARFLQPALRSDDVFVRKFAAFALSLIGPEAKGAAPDLAKLLDDENRQVRTEAILALGRMGEAAKDAVPTLTKLAANKAAPKSLRTSAATAIVLLKDGKEVGAPIVDILVQGLKSEGPKDTDSLHLQPETRAALAKVGQPAVQPLIGAIKKDFWEPDPASELNKAARLAAVLALGEIGMPANTDAVKDLLRWLAGYDPIPSICEAAKETSLRFLQKK